MQNVGRGHRLPLLGLILLMLCLAGCGDGTSNTNITRLNDSDAASNPTPTPPLTATAPVTLNFPAAAQAGPSYDGIEIVGYESSDAIKFGPAFYARVTTLTIDVPRSVTKLRILFLQGSVPVDMVTAPVDLSTIPNGAKVIINDPQNTQPALISITVNPASAAVAVSSTTRLTAQGTFSDNTTGDISALVVWSSSDTSKATVSNSGSDYGTVTGVAVGQCAVTAAVGSVSGSSTVTVGALDVASLAISPLIPTVGAGATQQFTATATYVNGTTQDVTTSAAWTSSNTGTATIGASTGLATAVAAGTTSIGASFGGQTASTTLTVTAAAPQFSVSGVLTYDRVAEVANSGLNYASITQKPIRGARVQLLDAASTVLGETVSGNDGSYAFSFADTVTQIKVRVYAETPTPHYTIQDNTNANAVYVMDSALTTAQTALTLNLNADEGGFAGGVYTTTRVAGPFALLDTVYNNAQLVTLARPALTIPALKINWSMNNSTATIGTSFFDGTELFILGKDGEDTDEYDQHVVAHEWGHYLEGTLSRSDSIGGSHSGGQILDPRLAFGEGYGNAISGMVLFPDSVYKDSFGAAQGSGFSFDVNDNNGDTVNPGWFSETSVQNILYDLFDTDVEGWDTIALGLGPILDVMTGAQKNTDALTTIFSFCKGLRDTGGVTDVALTALLNKHSIQLVQDKWGTGETNNAGNPVNLPVYQAGVVDDGVNYTTTTAVTAGTNKLNASKYLRVTGTGANIFINVTGAVNSHWIQVFDAGQQVAIRTPTVSPDTFSFPSTAGKVYVVTVRRAIAGGPSNVVITFTSI